MWPSSLIITQELFQANAKNTRFVPVLFAGASVQLELAEMYVPLRIAGHRDLEHMRGKEVGRLGLEMHEDFELTELFVRAGACKHALLLGRPGSGKPTALRKLAQHCLREGAALLLPGDFIPVFVRLRRSTAADLD